LKAVYQAKTEASAATALMALEAVVAQTYAQRCADIADPDLRHLAASIGPVEAQHLTAYAFATGSTSLLQSSATVPGALARPASDVPA
jgi:hypothetical protein